MVREYENSIKITVILKTPFTSLIKLKRIITVILSISVDILPFIFTVLIFRKIFTFVEPPVLTAPNPLNKYKKAKIIPPPAPIRKRKRLKKKA